MDDGPGGCGVPDHPQCAGKYTHPGDPGSGGIGGFCMYHKNAYEHEPGAPTRTPGCSTGTQFPPPWKEGYVRSPARPLVLLVLVLVLVPVLLLLPLPLLLLIVPIFTTL